MPPNLYFEIDDAEDDWLRGIFDLIHFRFVAVFMKDPEQAFCRAFESDSSLFVSQALLLTADTGVSGPVVGSRYKRWTLPFSLATARWQTTIP